MSDSTIAPSLEWVDYYFALREEDGRRTLKRIRSRLYSRLEGIHCEIDHLEETMSRFVSPLHPEFVPLIEQKIVLLKAVAENIVQELRLVISAIEGNEQGS